MDIYSKEELLAFPDDAIMRMEEEFFQKEINYLTEAARNQMQRGMAAFKASHKFRINLAGFPMRQEHKDSLRAAFEEKGWHVGFEGISNPVIMHLK